MPEAMSQTKKTTPKVLLATPGAWWLPHPAKAFENRGALAGLWISHKNSTGVSPDKFRRCWPFHFLLKPFYHCAPQIWTEKMFYKLFPVWKTWLAAQPIPPETNVIQVPMGFASEIFDRAEKIGALKVVDCPNSHPITYYGFWQRECDLWCPGERVPIPHWNFARMNREFERADMIIVQSNFCKETMLMNGIPADKVMVNPMGADTRVFQPRTAVPEKIKFVCVGTICLRKGHQYLFRAFEIVKRALPDAELVCIGEFKTDFRKEQKRWAGTYTYHPHTSQAELAKILQTSTAFVFPSQEEGIARAQIEALAAGLPVIGTHEGGATTLVSDSVEGFIVRGRDPQHIADAMLRVATDRELNKKMGEAAHKKGAVKNTWQDYGDRLLAEYSNRMQKSAA